LALSNFEALRCEFPVGLRGFEPHAVKEYPDAGHAFLNDAEAGPRFLRPLLRVAGIGPEPDSAEDAWKRIGLFFATYPQG